MGTFVWPYSLFPHATTEPSFFKTTVLCPAAATAFTPIKPAGIVDWPALLSPHATTVPSLFKAMVW
jgi:hypothetical protein